MSSMTDTPPSTFEVESSASNTMPGANEPLVVMPTKPAVPEAMPVTAPFTQRAPAGGPTPAPAAASVAIGRAALPSIVPAADSAPQTPTVSTLASRALAPTVQRAPNEVPPAVQRFVERETGADLAGVTVHRNTGAQAASIQAKAFTVDGEVHVPEHHGPLDEGEGRNLLAHELTHVAQQRQLGGSRPLEHTDGGVALESEARGMEHRAAFANELNTPSAMTLASPPVAHTAQAAPEPSVARWTDPGQAAIDAGVAQRAADGSVVFNFGGGSDASSAGAPPASANPPAGGSGGDSDYVQRAEFVAGDESVQRAAAGGAGAGAGDEAQNKKVYEYVYWRLRRELRLNTEQYGNGAGLQRL
jgi:hypothetical protein